jgi:YHS domain-containing protein
MRKFALVALVAFVLGLAAVPFVNADEHPTKASENVTNKYCPVMGLDGFSDPTIRAEHDGQYVYFCCEGCLKMYAKDPAKYIPNLPAEDQEAIKANAVCPVGGEKIANRDVRGEYKGKLVYFCCAGCKTTYDKKNVTD